MTGPGSDPARAIEAVRAELAALPAPPVPAELRARLQEALGRTRCREPARCPVRARRKVAGAAAAVLVTAAIALLAGTAATLTAREAAQVPVALRLSAAALADARHAGLADRDLGPLAAPGRLERCLAAAGVTPSTMPPSGPLGARAVLLDGREGVLLVLPVSGDRLRLVVVDPSCGAPGTAGSPVLADTTVAR